MEGDILMHFVNISLNNMKKIIFAIYTRAYKAKVKKNYKEHNKLLWILCLVTMHFMYRCIGLYLRIYKLFGTLPQPLNNNHQITISLTSFPARIKSVWKTIDSLFYQTYLPSTIELYLSLDEFPNKLEDLPSSLKRYIPLGLKIFFVDGNIKPHKKYFYVFMKCKEESKNKIFVTVDDDVYYLPDMLLNLYELHIKHPKAICSNVIHHIRQGKPYASWDNEYTPNIPSNDYIAIGCGGILYDTSLFKNNYFLDIPLFESVCPIADDIWLKGAEIVNNIPVVTGPFNIPFINLIGTQKQALWKKNTNTKVIINNDTQWRATIDYLKQCDLYSEKKKIITV